MADSSIYLAQFWGWYIVLFCGLLIIKPKRTEQLLSYLEDDKYLVITSLFGIILGLITITLHNIWEPNWKLIITLIGWTALIKGVVRFTFPITALKTINKFNMKWMPILFVALFFIGLLLLNEVYQWIVY